MILALLVIVVAISARLGERLLRSFRIPGLLLVSIVVINGLLFPGGRDVLASLGPLAITREGLTFGVVSAVRLAVVFGASMLLLLTTRPDDLLEGLVARGVSHRIAFVVLSAVQLIPRMRDRADRILAAQSARGLAVDGSVRHAGARAGAAHRAGHAERAGRCPRANARPRGARVRRQARADRVPRRAGPAVDRPIRIGLLVATALVVVAAVVGVGR